MTARSDMGRRNRYDRRNETDFQPQHDDPFASLFSVSVMAAEAVGVRDKRTVIALDEAGRAALVEEMRHHLIGIQAIADALAKDDLLAAARAARASGMSAAREADPHMQAQLPENFKKLGFGMHSDFDAMAVEAEERKEGMLRKRRVLQLWRYITAYARPESSAVSAAVCR